MDLNTMAATFLALMERQTVALETLAAASKSTATINPPVVEEKKPDPKPAKTPAPTVEQTKASADSSSTDASASAEKPAPTQSEPEPEAQPEAQPEAVKEEKPENKGKPLSADDVRKALQGFAAVEGNAAAVELLNSFGATSISTLVALGQESIDNFVAACKGATQ